MGLGMVRSGFDDESSDVDVLGRGKLRWHEGYIHALTFDLRVMSFMTLQTTNR